MSFIKLTSLIQDGRVDDHPVAIRNGEIIPFGRFRADVLSIAGQFRNRRIALACADSYYYAVGLFGLLHAGADIILPQNTLPLTLQGLKDDFDYLIDDAAIANSPSQNHGSKTFDDARPSLHFFTSGSTGASKRIVKSLSMFEAETIAIHELWGHSSGVGPVFSSVPHHHVYGLSFKMLWPLAAGIPFDCATPGPWEILLAALQPGSILVSSPAHLNRLSGLSPLAVSHALSRIFCAGAPLSYMAAQETKSVFGCLPTEIFGSTETCAIATREQTENHKPWSALPGVTVECGNDGRMNLRSPFVGHDWVTTEDRIEAAGQGFHFLGRADDIVKIEGRRVSLIQVERALCDLPFINDAAVILLDAEESQLGAVLELTAEGRAELEAIGSFRFSRVIRHALAPFLEPVAMPRQWRFVDTLPLQHMGKRKVADIMALFSPQEDRALPTFSILSQDKNALALHLDIDRSHDAFNGHFPDALILPGVVQLDWAIRFATRYLATGESTSQSFKIKFQQPILPGAVRLDLNIDRVAQRLSFSYTWNDRKFSSGQIRLESVE